MFSGARVKALLAVAACLPFAVPGAVQAQTPQPSLMDSFRIGTGGGALCQAQSNATDGAISGMFDRSWTVVCRDSALPVGRMFALRGMQGEGQTELVQRVIASRKDALSCSAAGGITLEDIGAVQAMNCMSAGGIASRITAVTRGRFTYVTQGIASYASALDLGLRTIVADRIIEGEIEVATLGGQDDAAFARAQAEALDPQVVLAEGYRRNNSGNYAEAAEFFDSLNDRISDEEGAAKLSPAERTNRAHEYQINRALQLSNLGEFGSADRLFRLARAIPTADPVQLRLRRNFEAMHLLNQGKYEAALALLNRPLATMTMTGAAADGAVEIDAIAAAELNSAVPTAQTLTMGQDTTLTAAERAAIIDAQAQQLRGTALRLSGKPGEARPLIEKALADAVAIRDGRVTSITRLRAQLLAEIALTHEAQGDMGKAEALLRQGVDLLAVQYPETVAMNGARARLAAFLARRGRNDEAMGIYRTVIDSTVANRNALTGLNNHIAPYFDLLVEGLKTKPELAGDLFLASQTLMRPGAADTMEVLTRELSGGTSEAARLFRQSVSLSRDIERARIELAQLEQQAERNSSAAALVAAQQRDIEALAQQQAATLGALSAYPQYRAVSKDALSLADLQAALKPGEAYLKLAQIGDAIYAIYVDAAGATGYRAGISAGDLDDKVAELRETISTNVNGVQTTYAFDVRIARELYVALIGPIDARLADVRHLIFEPDGAMLQLPVNLLIASQDGVDAYLARLDKRGNDEFDFRGIDWLGRDHAVSTSLSAKALRDARRAPDSAAKRDYIGFGENAPVNAMRKIALTRSAISGAANGEQAADCSWPTAQWASPIAATELRSAARLLGKGGSEVVTGVAFTDENILARDDLSEYRILHFATHGLVTAPRRECPARPALVTSFGAPGKSDGLLQFGEIFDLKLDANLVILSACDTAGKASKEATREAGLGSGGGSALDGLVRAFIGAGGRSVIASHWPAPDEYKATERLITGLFTAGADVPVAQALQSAQIKLMDDAETSHPFYWSGFSVIGDGARPLVAQH
tara:strand:- start:56023 stop:59163 length:3141 start_codon:yes stop_codon:yes gene_type:complete